MKFNLKDFKRFEKQIILKKIGISGQKKIKNSKILIIGMGGLGCPLLTYLASSGVCNIGIVDHDKKKWGRTNTILLKPTQQACSTCLARPFGKRIQAAKWGKNVDL